jgi:2-oxo-4-hydroxy-4-carboxy-5-ureidoimidazoline decarboxylase
MSTISLDEVNRLEAAAFVDRLGGVFEHSPWVAEAVQSQRPFESIDALHSAMCAVVAGSSQAAQLALIRAHPELAGRAAIRGELTDASRDEQAGAGLDRCSAQEFAELHALNDAYHARFDFPFILAVRGHTRHSILASMRARLDNTPAAEMAEALRQIERIAALRLLSMIEQDTP